MNERRNENGVNVRRNKKGYIESGVKKEITIVRGLNNMGENE